MVFGLLIKESIVGYGKMSERESPHCSSYYQSFIFLIFEKRCSEERIQRLGLLSLAETGQCQYALHGNTD